MTMASWVTDKLGESGYYAQEVGSGGVRIEGTATHGDVLIYVGEASAVPFEVADFERVAAAHPTCQAIVMIRRAVGIGVVEAAASDGVLVAPFGHVKQALGTTGEIGAFLHQDEIYLRSRLLQARHVTDVVRIGTQSWRIERTGGLDLEIITHDRYEFPVSELRELLAQHPGLTPDAFVITNPNCRGLSTRVQEASKEVGVEVHLLNDFFARIARP
ncbi:hypothetical protein [uncultured Microbacterium sp.]|uniref:hypothetical protein n=1 Tax=uncultured Microbacterium sp. TaxID=191216 RepID=UPI0028EB53DC|nr:hypothetical protein [uncultured Microbacterium sp.]